MVRIENNKLILEITGTQSPQQELCDIQNALLYVIRCQDTNMVDTDKNAILIDFLMEILPTSEQINMIKNK